MAAAGTPVRNKAAGTKNPETAANAPSGKQGRPAVIPEPKGGAEPEGQASGTQAAARAGNRPDPERAYGPDAAEEAETVLYRALSPCRVGHYRETGEVFGWPRFRTRPSYLEEVKNGIRPTPSESGKAMAAPGATVAEILGIGRD